MRFLLVPGLPFALMSLGIDTRAASVPPLVLTVLNTFPYLLGIILILCLLMRFARHR
jgi:hypothetical protein